MTYPDTIISYPNRVDKNASGWYISGEYFNIPASSPYQMYLDHVPNDAATTEVWSSGVVTEWTEDLTGTPAAGEFYVEYDIGRFTFNSANTGEALEARYNTLGDDIMAEHTNNMQNEVYAVETELGLGIAGGYADLSQRLDTFLAGSVAASQVTMDTPVGLTATAVQEFVDLSGTASRNSNNPFGIGWNDIFDSDGDMVRAQNTAKIGALYANTVSASGSIIAINVDGPNNDQWVYFYDGIPAGQWFKWTESDSRFELSADTTIHGEITASGNIIPDASGTRNVGSPALAFAEGHFDKLVVPEMKTGTDQAAAGAGFMELWADSNDDYTVKLGT